MKEIKKNETKMKEKPEDKKRPKNTRHEVFFQTEFFWFRQKVKNSKKKVEKK